jgi:hypothetical protein
MRPHQATGNKDEPNIVFMWESQRTSQNGTRNVKTQKRMKTSFSIVPSVFSNVYIQHVFIESGFI